MVGSPIGHGCGRNENRGRLNGQLHGVAHLHGRQNIDPLYAPRRRQAHRPGNERDSGARMMGGLGNGKTHFAAGQIGDASNRVNRLIGGAGCNEHMLALKHFGGPKGKQFIHNFFGFEHAAITRFAAGLIALPYVQHMRAIGLELGHIALCGWVSPHFSVHSRRNNQGHRLNGPGQTHEAEQFIGLAMDEFGHEIGTGWGNQDGIGIAA